MSNFLYIAKQPIFGKDEHIFGYELYYRQDDQKMTLPDKRLATASVLVNTLNQMGLHTLVGSSKAADMVFEHPWLITKSHFSHVESPDVVV